MKIIFTIIISALFILLTLSLNAQITSTSKWTWVKGDTEPLHAGVYGTKGVADANNTPGAREFSVTWTDASGNLWLFGGVGYGTSSILTGDLNDMWKYNISSKEWTWISGDNTINQTGTYGTMGTPATTNTPGARRSSVAWMDATGNLWLFGGYGYPAAGGIGHLNDVWKYNPSTNEWTWVRGDNAINQASVFGTKGTADAANTPGARYGSVEWTDASGNFWLFGGITLSVGFLNDLWKYDPVADEWTWINGDNTGGQLAVFGTKGIAAPTNKPGSRHEGFTWTDAPGNFWLFGGYGAAAAGFGYLSDLWKYDPTTNEWTWVNGNNATNQPGIYGIKGTADAANNPGGRFEGAQWRDASGNFWVFGGGGYDASSNLGNLNDLWQYNPSANEWTWVKGSNTDLDFGVYGTQGIADAANKPGIRAGSLSWKDASDNFWLFGGEGSGQFGTGALNDLWLLGGGSTVPVTLLNISAQLVQKNALIVWQTSQEINTSDFIIERSADGVIFFPIGSVEAAGNSSAMKKYSFTDQQPLQGTSFYRVKMADIDGNAKYTSIVKINTGVLKNTISVFPNPVTRLTTINLTADAASQLQFILYDYKGSLIDKKKISLLAGTNSFSIDMSKFSKGIYRAVLTWANETQELKIMKE